jgi:protein arginine kinase activator
MLCDNCGKREANIRYSENINGRKKELNLCEECSKKLGISNIDFSMPIDFSSFFGEFMEDFSTPEFMPLFSEIKALKCENCGNTFEDIANTGKLGCENCYDVFEERLDPIIRRIQGANHHVGRVGKIIDSKIDKKISNKSSQKEENINNKPEETKKENKLEKLQEELKQAIKEERYEDAAKIRDEIKKID